MGPSEIAATSQHLLQHAEAPMSVRQVEVESGTDAAEDANKFSDEHGSCRQNPPFVDTSNANVCHPTSPSNSKLFHTTVQTLQIPSRFGTPKDASLDFLKSLLLWLFPNLLVCLVFAVTLTACLVSNATVEFDLCFLLLLIASWAFLAPAARRNESDEEVAGTRIGKLDLEAPCELSQKLALPENDTSESQFSQGAAVQQGSQPSASALEDEVETSSLKEDKSSPALEVASSAIGQPETCEQSCSVTAVEAAVSWNTSGSPSVASIIENDEGSPDAVLETLAGEAEAETRETDADAEAPQTDAEKTEIVQSAAAADDMFPFLCEEEAARTPKERERTIDEVDAEEASLSGNEQERGYSYSSGVLSLPAAPVCSTSRSSSDFAPWLGALGEINLSSSVADLSFCRTQSLAATLSLHDQSMSVDIEGPPLPACRVSCLAEEPDSKNLLPLKSTQELGQALSPYVESLQQQQESPHVSTESLPGLLGEEPSQGAVEGSTDVASLESLFDKQPQQQPLIVQQIQRHGSVSGVSSASVAPARRSGPPRRMKGSPVGGKMQRRESRAALQYYMGLVKDCCKRRDGAGALRVLEEVQRQGKVAPDVQLLNYVLFACVASQDAFLTKRLFEFIEGAGVADIVTYNTMLKSFSLSGQLEEAEKILRRMRGRSVPPDEVSFNLLVNAAVSCGRIDRAWHYVDELRNAHMVPDKFTISSLVKSLQPGQNPKLIQRTLRLMDGVDVCEDLILLSTCIDATLRLGDTERLRRLLDRFEGSSLSPNAHAYGTLIKAYGRLGNLSRVWGLWKDLQAKKNMEPTNYTYGCMLDILLSNNLLADATQLFCRMVQQGVVDAVHFSILVKGLSKYNNHGVCLALEAYSVLQSSAAFRRSGAEGGKNNHGREGERNQSQAALNTISFNALLHLCVVNGRMEDALRLFHDMERQDTVAPDLISYSTVIKGLCCCPGDAPLERALSLLDQMQKRYGIRPDAIVFNTLIQGAATRKNPALVEHLLSLMQQSNVPPSSYTLCQCVKLYGKCNNLQRALELANELPARFGFTIDGYVYTALIAACMSNGATVLAGQLALQATSSGIEIPPGVLCRLWNTLHFMRATQLDTVENVAELNEVYEAIWELVGPQSKDPSSIGLEGIGVRRSRRRGGKHHANVSSRQRQQHSSNSNNNVGSGSASIQEQQRHTIPQGAITNFISAVQRDWEGFSDPPVLEGVGDRSDMEAAGMWRAANGGMPW